MIVSDMVGDFDSTTISALQVFEVRSSSSSNAYVTIKLINSRSLDFETCLPVYDDYSKNLPSAYCSLEFRADTRFHIFDSSGNDESDVANITSCQYPFHG